MNEDIIQRAELEVTHLHGCVIETNIHFRCDCAVGDVIRQLADAGLLVDESEGR